MKLLIYYEQLGYGGVDTHLANLVNHWPGLNDRITILSNNDNEGLDFLKKKVCRSNVAFKTLDFCSSFTRGPSFLKAFRFFWNRFFCFPREFLRAINRVRPDVILSDNGGYPGGITCFLAPIISKLFAPRRKAALLIHHAPGRSRFLIRKLTDLLALSVILLRIPVISVSQASKKSIEGATPLRGITVINNGIGIKESDEENSFRSRYRIDRQKILLGMIGPIDAHKGHKVFIESFISSDFLKENAHAVVVGKGDCNFEKELRFFSAPLELLNAITFTGFLSEDSEAIIRQFDILVMPTTEFEGFGYSAAEAMAAGVPVVASRVGAIPDIIEDGKTGILVKPNDHYDLALALEKLVKDFSYRRLIAEKAKEFIISHFSAAKMAERYHNLLNLNDRKAEKRL